GVPGGEAQGGAPVPGEEDAGGVGGAAGLAVHHDALDNAGGAVPLVEGGGVEGGEVLDGEVAHRVHDKGGLGRGVGVVGGEDPALADEGANGQVGVHVEEGGVHRHLGPGALDQGGGGLGAFDPVAAQG